MKKIILCILLGLVGCSFETNKKVEIPAYVSWDMLDMPINTSSLEETQQFLLMEQSPRKFRNSDKVFYNCYLDEKLLEGEIKAAKKDNKANNEVAYNTYFYYKKNLYLVRDNDLVINGKKYTIPMDFDSEMRKMKKIDPNYQEHFSYYKKEDFIKEFYFEKKLGSMCNFNFDSGWSEVVPRGLVF